MYRSYRTGKTILACAKLFLIELAVLKYLIQMTVAK
jgi:hypothetical protein